MTMTRLDCLLANRGYCFRSRTREFLRQCEVAVAGQRLLDPSRRVDESAVTVDGQPVDPPRLWILLHKPLNTICSHSDAGPLIYALLPPRWLARKPQITSVGRLDRDTTGLLLLSDDGELVHRLTSPRQHVPRVYVAKLEKPLAGQEAALFASGTLILPEDDKPLLPATLEAIDAHTARLTLYEGRYHQVKRMFEAVGNSVTALHRESFGPLSLADLPAGQWRLLQPREVDQLRSGSAASTHM
jgi:16S rRNA pseudouridine516 synthase